MNPNPWRPLTAGCWLVLAGLVLVTLGRAAESSAPTPRTAKEWNERGSQLAAQQQWQPAIAAFGEAIRLAPQRSELLVNRAVVYQSLGQWELADGDCTAAIAINPEDTRAFLHRAIARTELGRQAEAFKDASRAARMEPDNSKCVFIRHLLCSRTGRHDLGHTAGETYIGLRGWGDAWSPYVALLNHASLRRAGDAVAARAILTEAAIFVATDQWPAPLIQFLQGDLPEAALLAAAQEPDRATLARYYTGVRHWLDGDAAQARPHFEWIVAHGDPAFLQHKLAGDHLKELSGTAGATAASKE